MSIGNFPPRVLNFNTLANAASAPAVYPLAIPATPVNSALGTSLQIMRRVGGGEIRYTLPEGIYTMSAQCTLTIADAETFAQQVELQIVRLDGAFNPFDTLATFSFALNRLGYAGGAGVATFANIANVDYTLQCARGSIEVFDGQVFTIRALINGLPTGGSTINSCRFVASRVGSNLLLDKIDVV